MTDPRTQVLIHKDSLDHLLAERNELRATLATVERTARFKVAITYPTGSQAASEWQDVLDLAEDSSGLHPCLGCGIELDADDLNPMCEECE